MKHSMICVKISLLSAVIGGLLTLGSFHLHVPSVKNVALAWTGLSSPLEQRAGLFSFLLNLIGISSNSSNNRSPSGSSSTYAGAVTVQPKFEDASLYTTDGSDEVPVNGSKSFTLFSQSCRSVTNERGDVYEVMVPINSAAEWDSFQQNLPAGVTLGNCLCGKSMTLSQVNQALIQATGSSPMQTYASASPNPGDAPPYYTDALTVGHICKLLGCGGGAVLLSTASFSSAGNNTILRWDGSNWVKFWASQSNSKLNHSGPSLRCNP